MTSEFFEDIALYALKVAALSGAIWGVYNYGLVPETHLPNYNYITVLSVVLIKDLLTTKIA